MILSGFVLDQVTKFWARTNLESENIEVIPDFFKLHLAFNKGVAFSIPITRWFSSALSLLIIGYIFWVLKDKSEKNKWGYYFILAGAFGNLFDRLWFGEVTDFLSVLSFPIFNIADAFVSVGVVLLLWGEIFAKKK